MRGWRRGAEIFLRLFPFVIAFLRDRRRLLLFGSAARRSEEHHRRRAERLTATIAKLGPTFIKLAQVFSARADIIPEPYLSAISGLQDRVPPVSFAAIDAVIASELGGAADTVFSEFEHEPVAAASLGQVHRARIGERKVAVKVLRPEVESLVAIDLEISFRLIYLLNILFPNHHVRALTNVLREFSVRVREEMDFREEAAHIALFRSRFAKDTRVRAPDVVPELVRQRVLVMDWLEGDKIDKLAPRFASGQLDFRRVMDTLIETYVRMTLVDGFLHADPHPGNILVQQDGTIVFLDWGMVVNFSRPTRESILRISMASAREDLDGMINGMYELGMIDPGISRNEIREAAAEILAIVDRARELGHRRAQEMVQEIMDTFYTWPLMLPRELVYFFRAAVLLEGIGYRYDPGFNGLDAARPVIRRMRAELLQVAARQPVEIARGLMDEARASIAAFRDILGRAEREEFRVRVHPRDLLHFERFMQLQVRRVLLSIFAFTTALITSITFVAVRNHWLLIAGLVVALVMFLIVLVLPTHLLENPLRHARGIRVER